MNASDAPGVEVATPDAAVAMLPEGLIHDDEIIILLLRPSVLFIPLSCLPSVATLALAAFFFAYLAPFVATWQLWISWTGAQALSVGFGFIILRLAWQVLEWYSRVYVLTDRRVLRRMGVLRVAVFQAELKSIQHTSVFAGVRERLFGLGSIGFATAGSDTFDAFWVMVRQPFAVHRVVAEAIRRYGKH
jgi:uncharacterized membrane protein YdbT with pleckstrin-like domain